MPAEIIQSLLNQMNELTTEALHQLHEMTEEQFEDFATKRELLTQKLEGYRNDITDGHRVQIATLLDSDPIILQRMTFLKDEAGKWLERKGTVRTQQNAYQHAYVGDSLFVDHRK
ncbi:hypothetical protein [Paenibacillus wulumuqiensis]|uniref:hypothetical protein n=1 Tax=Paenibacillus wulumuqiensis TaxID=1567107 RepID=UPI0006191F95|nr:hypothetical protein [Paenibacillus wulumuqiensis]